MGRGEVVRLEPYSMRTGERLRISAWEKIDFGVTAFTYGLSMGATFAVLSDSGDIKATMTGGALAYTALALAYLGGGKPDRGDLPLALAISSYVPMAAMLAYGGFVGDPTGEGLAAVLGTSALIALPIAGAAASKLDLDPGDTQLVRDAAFWGMVLAFLGTYGFEGEHGSSPSGETGARVTLAGLLGGLGVGLVAASRTNVSLERVRAATWGGYGGLALGALVGSSGGGGAAFGGAAIGAAIGMFVTLGMTAALDRVPDDADLVSDGARMSPALTSVRDASGAIVPALGPARALP